MAASSNKVISSWADDEVDEAIGGSESWAESSRAAGGQTAEEHYEPERDREEPRDRDYREPRERSRPQLAGPPYTAYVGNLSYEATEEEICDLFGSHCRVRLVQDRDTGRLKGFGYVEFDALADLEHALTMDRHEYRGRPLRMDVADNKQSRGGDGRRFGGRGGFREAGGRSRDYDEHDRRGGPRDYEDRDRRYGGDRRDFDDRSRRAAPRSFDERDARPAARDYGDRDRRPARREEREKDQEREQETQPGAAERPHLTLRPRTVQDPPAAPAVPARSKGDPFGGAKPRDESEYQRRKDEERARREQEKKDQEAKKEQEAEQEKEQEKAPVEAKKEEAAPVVTPAVATPAAAPAAPATVAASEPAAAARPRRQEHELRPRRDDRDSHDRRGPRRDRNPSKSQDVRSAAPRQPPQAPAGPTPTAVQNPFAALGGDEDDEE